MENIKDGAYRIYISSAAGMDFTGSTANSVEEAKEMVKKWEPLNEYAEYVVVTPDHKHVSIPHSIWDSADVDNAHSKWTKPILEVMEYRKTHDPERIWNELHYFTPFHVYPEDKDEVIREIKRIAKRVQGGMRPMFNDGKIVGCEGRSMDGIPYGIYQEGGRSYRGFEITSNENGLRKGVYRFYNWGGGVPFGNSAVDGHFSEAQFQKLIGEGKVKLLDSILEDCDFVEDARTVRANMLSAGRKIVGDENEVWTVVSVKKDGGGVEVAVKNDKGERDNWYFESSEQVPLADSVVDDAKTEYVFNWRDTYHGTRERTRVDANSVGEAIREFANMIALGGVGTANAFVISVSPNDGYVALYGKVSDLVKKFKDSVAVCDADVKVGQRYQNARLSTLTVTNITNNGNVEWQFSRGGDVYGAPVSSFKTMLEKNGYRRIEDSTKMFKVVDKVTGKTLLVKATDSLAAVKRVSSLKDTAYTVTARTNDFPYGNNVAVIVDANSEDEAVAKCRKVFEARGDKINYISATPTTSSDIAKGISRFKN